MRTRLDNEIIGTADWQNLLTWMRRLFVPACILAIGVFGAIQLDGYNPANAADQFKIDHPLFQYFFRPILIIFEALFNQNTLRYMLCPTISIILVIVMAASFVQDIYALKRFRDAFRYVFASMFSGFLGFFGYPVLVVDKGEKQLAKHQVNLINEIGGPGYVVIEPGNAVMFRTLRHPSRVAVATTYFLAPFETIAQTMFLDDQQSDKDEIKAMTRDGIKVILRDVHFRYRIKHQVRNGAPVVRSLTEPYPFEEESMMMAAFNLAVAQNGQETWNASVERVVTGNITDFIAANTLDYLTAPVRKPEKSYPRLEFNKKFFEGIQKGLSSLGAELIWVDIGHLHIEEESIDDQRAGLWAARWVGDANVTRAFGDAKRLAYQEMGRAEAQAELILSITDAFKDAISEPGSTYNLRKLIMVRTAQLLDAMQTQQEKKDSGDKKT